ncbi:MAG TPA: response regulator [Bryobacteraceae bacterium]|nr:response regulator [Bryobacteraceae bacterium]
MPPARPYRREVKKLQILAVSASESDQQELGRILAPLPWAVHRANSRVQAIEIMRRKAISIVLCDSDLPDGSWKDILHESSREPNPPCVIVTTPISDDAPLWSEVLNLGGYEVLAKPFDAREVFHSISTCCRTSREAVQPHAATTAA